MDRKLETKTVRQALAKAGINARVGHGTGTAWGWLEINVGSPNQFTHPHEDYCDCAQCLAANSKIFEIGQQARAIAAQVTGRTGEYHGQISILTQKHWNAGRKCDEEIVQPAPDDYDQLVAEREYARQLF